MPFKLSLDIHTDEIGEQTHTMLQSAVDKAALDIQAHAQAAIHTGPKTGRIYGAHQASAPGEAPATDTGTLAGSIRTERAGGNEIRTDVVVGAEYGAALEFGTSEIEPRPFIGPAVEAVRPSFEHGVAAAMRQGADG